MKSPLSSISRRELWWSYFLLAIPLAVIFRLTILVRQRSGDEFLQVDLAAGIQVVLVALCAVVLLVAPSSKRNFRKMFGTSVGALIAYYLVALLSFLWSSEPGYTAFRAIEFIILASAVFCSFCYLNDPLQIERRGIICAMLIMIMGVGMHIKLGGISLLSLHTNSYSVVAAMITCYCITEWLIGCRGKRKRLLVFAGTVSLLFLLVGTSSASFVSAMVGVAIAAFIVKNKALLFLCLFVIVPVSIFVGSDAFMSVIFSGRSLEQIASGTGRTWLWALILEQVVLNPWLGSGFAVSSRTLGHYMTNTHNGYIAALLGAGIVGLIFLARFCLRVVIEGLRLFRESQRRGIGAFVALAVIIVNNLSTSVIGELWTTAGMGGVVFLSMQVRFIQIERTRQLNERALLYVR